MKPARQEAPQLLVPCSTEQNGGVIVDQENPYKCFYARRFTKDKSFLKHTREMWCATPCTLLTPGPTNGASRRQRGGWSHLWSFTLFVPITFEQLCNPDTFTEPQCHHPARCQGAWEWKYWAQCNSFTTTTSAHYYLHLPLCPLLPIVAFKLCASSSKHQVSPRTSWAVRAVGGASMVVQVHNNTIIIQQNTEQRWSK